MLGSVQIWVRFQSSACQFFDFLEAPDFINKCTNTVSGTETPLIRMDERMSSIKIANTNGEMKALLWFWHARE